MKLFYETVSHAWCHTDETVSCNFFSLTNKIATKPTIRSVPPTFSCSMMKMLLVSLLVQSRRKRSVFGFTLSIKQYGEHDRLVMELQLTVIPLADISE